MSDVGATRPEADGAGTHPPRIGDSSPELRERAALVALLRHRRARWSEAAHEVLEAGSALDVLRQRLRVDEGLFPETDPVEHALAEAADELRAWTAEGIAVQAFFDADYPAHLRDIHQMPPLLFTQGNLGDDSRAIAVVGTRQATEQGLETAAAVASELASAGVTVVSGLARGIDAAAHEAALAVGGRTVAVIGTGIRRFYPAENRALQARIANEGLVISQFWPDAPPAKHSFLMRNAVMSGYAAATLVVEAPWRSGARSQARLALEHGRPVILPVDMLVHDWARDFARRAGVHVVHGAKELLDVANELIREANISPDALPEGPRLAWT